MRPKLKKQSALNIAGRIIPQAAALNQIITTKINQYIPFFQK
jgi:hypothetical protein